MKDGYFVGVQESMECYGGNDYRDYYLAHHGILGQKWGVRRFQSYSVTGPRKGGKTGKEIGLAKRLSKGVGAIKAKLNKKNVAAKRAATLEKARKAKEEKEAILRSGSAKKMMENKDKFTTEEIEEFMKRAATETRLAQLREAQSSVNFEKADQINESVKKVAGYLQTASNFAVQGKNLYTNGKDLVDLVSGKKKKEEEDKKAKEKAKQELLNSGDPERILAAAKNLTADELQKANKHILQEGMLKKTLQDVQDKKVSDVLKVSEDEATSYFGGKSKYDSLFKDPETPASTPQQPSTPSTPSTPQRQASADVQRILDSFSSRKAADMPSEPSRDVQKILDSFSSRKASEVSTSKDVQRIMESFSSKKTPESSASKDVQKILDSFSSRKVSDVPSSASSSKDVQRILDSFGSRKASEVTTSPLTLNPGVSSPTRAASPSSWQRAARATSAAAAKAAPAFRAASDYTSRAMRRISDATGVPIGRRIKHEDAFGMEYYGDNDWRNYHLAHYGVKGMEWGKTKKQPDQFWLESRLPINQRTMLNAQARSAAANRQQIAARAAESTARAKADAQQQAVALAKAKAVADARAAEATAKAKAAAEAQAKQQAEAQKPEQTKEEKAKSDAAMDKIVDDVINGKYGNGEARKKALEKEGQNWAEIQNKVNEKLGSSVRHNVDATNKAVENMSDTKVSELSTSSKNYFERKMASYGANDVTSNKSGGKSSSSSTSSSKSSSSGKSSSSSSSKKDKTSGTDKAKNDSGKKSKKSKNSNKTRTTQKQVYDHKTKQNTSAVLKRKGAQMGVDDFTF